MDEERVLLKKLMMKYNEPIFIEVVFDDESDDDDESQNRKGFEVSPLITFEQLVQDVFKHYDLDEESDIVVPPYDADDSSFLFEYNEDIIVRVQDTPSRSELRQRDREEYEEEQALEKAMDEFRASRKKAKQ